MRAYVIQRLKEPTTYVGLGLIAIALGAPDKLTHTLVDAMTLIVGGGLVSFTEAGR
jgi:hypothetical protein